MSSSSSVPEYNFAEETLEQLAIVQWLQSFGVEVASFSQINAHLLGQILHELSPQYFELSDTKPVSKDADVETQLKTETRNVQKLLGNLQRFANEKIHGSENLKIHEIVRVKHLVHQKQPEELLRLVELVFLCAVKSDNQQKAIENVLKLEEQLQQELQVIIEDVLRKYDPDYRPVSEISSLDQVGTTLDSPARALSITDLLSPERNQMSPQNSSAQYNKQRIKFMDDQIQQLEKDKNVLELKLDKMKEEIEALAASVLSKITSAVERERLSQRDKHDEELRTVLKKIEMAKEEGSELRRTLQQKIEHNNDIQRQFDEMVLNHKEEILRITDQLDIEKSKARKCMSLEHTVERYKKRLESTVELKHQLQSSETLRNTHLQKISGLEKEVQRIPTLRAQVTKYKNDAETLQHRLEKTSSQQRGHNEKVASLEQKLQAQQEEVELLRGQLISAKGELLSREQEQHTTEQHATDPTTSMMTNAELITPELKEEIARLRIENRMLKKSSNSNNDDLEDELDTQKRINVNLQKKISERESANQELNTKVRTMHETMAGLKSKISLPVKTVTSDEHMAGASSSTVAELERTQLTARAEAAQAKSQLQVAEMRIEKLTTSNKKLRDFALRAKKKFDHDKLSLQKVHESHKHTVSGFNELKRELKEKDDELVLHKKLKMEAKEAQKREERLISSSFYEIGLELQRSKLASDKVQKNKSWLNQQRNKRY